MIVSIGEFESKKPIKNSIIRLYSTLGQEVKQVNIDNETQIQLNVYNWNQGIYLYGVYVEGELVKQGQVLIGN
jgi:hypothetical protein